MVATITRFLSRMAHSATAVRRPFTIAVEGNIGSGKTTFLNHIKDLNPSDASMTVISEPIDLWRNCEGHNLLGLMYQDPEKWSFTFQSFVQLTMLQNHMEKRDSMMIKLMERSIHSARYCFVEKMKRDGILQAPAFSVLDQWFTWICQNQDVCVDVFVYLRTSPKVVYERIVSRNRSEEKSVPYEYIEGLHNLHEEWLIEDKRGTPVFVIDANRGLSEIGEEYQKFESEVLNKKTILAG